MLKTTSAPSLRRGALLCGLVAMTAPVALVGCGSPAPQPTETSSAPVQPQAKAGLSTKQKVVLLAGAAAMYYLYRKFQRDNAAQLANQKVQYYVSKSTGRIYYRDPKTHQAIWVTPPPSQVGTQQIPSEQAQEYSQIQGYQNSPSGQSLSDLLPVQ